MALPVFTDRVGDTTTTTSTTDYVLSGTPLAGYQEFADGVLYDYVAFAVDGSGVPNGAWEVGQGAYASSGTTLARTTIFSSSTGSKISWSSGTKRVLNTVPAFVQTYQQLVMQTYITGLLITKNSTTSIAVSAGSCWDPSSNQIITYAGGTLSPTLGASEFFAVYLYDSSGTATLEAFAEDPPSTAYAGTARKRGSGHGGRWIGSFVTDASSHVIPVQALETAANRAQTTYIQANTYTAPQRILSNGNASTYTQVSAAGAIPRYVGTQLTMTWTLNYATTGGAIIEAFLSLDGTNDFVTFWSYVPLANTYPGQPVTIPFEPSTPKLYYFIAASSPGVGQQMDLDVASYDFVR